MHIPDTLLQGAVCPITAVMSSIGLAAAVVAAAKSDNKPTPMTFGAVAALIFAGQMLNFPVPGGTSGHLLGGVLAASLLGVPFGVLAMGLVVLVQCLIFADGGIASLGSNLLNMALIAPVVGGVFLSVVARHGKTGPFVRSALLAGAAWMSVMLAAFAVSVELAASGPIALATVSQAMLSVHALIGIGESLITVAAFWLLVPLQRNGLDKRRYLLSLAVAVALALMLSPLASSLPDGLEWVAARYHLFLPSVAGFEGLVSGYVLPNVDHPYVTRVLAGMVGAAVVFSFAWLLARQFKRPRFLETWLGTTLQ
jgi:cobalt/nickel transport system permease protein